LNLFKKNKKFTSSLPIPKYISFFAKTLELLSSSLAASFGRKLFVTPIPFSTPKHEQFMLNSAQKKRLIVSDIKKEIEIVSYGYSKKKVLLIHGWSGRSSQLFSFADKLLENGYMIISFDGPAHGKSSGKTTMLPEFLKTIEKINIIYGPFEAAIGHSFGAMSILNAVSSFLNLKSLVSIGSGDKVSDIIKNFGKNLLLEEKSIRKIQKGLEKKWSIKVNDFSSSVVAKKIKIPTLIIHDSNDGDVPVSCAYRIRQNLENGFILITNKLGHTKILRNKEVVNKSIDFIIQHS
tara:strand:+ start:2726 stop:3601 length:876 start_codon:yes stop_codon:yes gene_type:complete